MDQFLSFYLTTLIQAMLPTHQLGKVINLTSRQIVPIFEVPEAVMGIYNHRGEVLWIVDFPYLLGLDPLFKQNSDPHYSVMVLHHQNFVSGLAVPEIGQLVSCETNKIKTSGNLNLSRKIAMCLHGVCQIPNRGDMLILDGKKIFDLLKLDI